MTQRRLNAQLILMFCLPFVPLVLCTSMRTHRYNKATGRILPFRRARSRWKPPAPRANHTWLRHKRLTTGRSINSVNDLTRHERNEMRYEISRSRAEYRLFTHCSSWGLMQYPFALLILALSSWSFFRAEKNGPRFIAVVLTGGSLVILYQTWSLGYHSALY
ncbi:MAG: hypothetical protein P1V97_26870 [Planctomycetota bacterium]|nr:hypothetical protein [Planctomycetota bacterium]